MRVFLRAEATAYGSLSLGDLRALGVEVLHPVMTHTKILTNASKP